MSHTTSIKAVKITDINALRAAILEMAKGGMKVSLVENQAPRAYFPNQAGMGVAPYVIKIPDAQYDVGVYKTADGYECRSDFFGGSVERILGGTPRVKENAEQAKLGRLFQMYGVHMAEQVARQKGHSVRRVAKQDGTIALELTGNM